MRERIVAVLAAIESDEGISFQCSQGIASILNQIGYDKGTIIYQIGNEVYSENCIGEKTLLYTVSEDILPNINSSFNSLSFEEKSALSIYNVSYNVIHIGTSDNNILT